MSSKLVIVAMLLCSSLVWASAVIAAQQRDEPMASRFLYCANVDQYWSMYLSKHNPEKTEAISAYSQAVNVLRLAAALVSDGDFIQKQHPLALKRLADVLDREEREHVNLMHAEARTCAETLEKDAVPILKAEQSIKK